MSDDIRIAHAFDERVGVLSTNLVLGVAEEFAFVGEITHSIEALRPFVGGEFDLVLDARLATLTPASNVQFQTIQVDTSELIVD